MKPITLKRPKTLYKLTTQSMRTYNDFAWELGESYEVSGDGGLCGPGWFHAYYDPLLAILLNPIHACIRKPRLFKARGFGKLLDDKGLKCGVTRLKLVQEISIPDLRTPQHIAFGILCAKQVCEDDAWNAWADSWLSGKNRRKADADAAFKLVSNHSDEASWRAARAARDIFRACARWLAACAAKKAVKTGQITTLQLRAIAKKAMKTQ